MTDREKLLAQLEALKIFPNNKLVRELRKQILAKLSQVEKSTPQKDSNQTRSGKLRRYHNYIRQIRNNFPDLSYSKIRKQLKERRQGIKVDIPDPVWQNPSP
jgi:DNA mismatch repair ATPase MutS